MRMLLLSGLLCCGSALQLLNAQEPSGSIRGVVWDSLRAQALPGAIVQLASVAPGGSGRSAIADANGAFVIPNAPRGRYLSFIHPFLDSIGVEAPVRSVEVGSRSTEVLLSSPAPARLHAALCGGEASADLNALVMSALRTAPGSAPLAGGKVT